jgi:hypothetical protein
MGGRQDHKGVVEIAIIGFPGRAHALYTRSHISSEAKDNI